MFQVDEIVSIEKINHDSARYDITVEDNHNFFANNILVHNCQNVYNNLKSQYPDMLFEASIKIDGSSMTVYKYNEEIGVCSRNLDLIDNDNTFWKTARQYNLIDKLSNYNRNLAIQGELAGQGIQGNNEKIDGHKYFVFDIYDIDERRYLLYHEKLKIIEELGLESVPTIGTLDVLNYSLEQILAGAEGSSYNPTSNREGLVYKSLEYVNGEVISFKAISNTFLLKQKD